MRKALGFTFLLCLLSGFAYANGVPGDPSMVVNDPTCTVTNGTQTIAAGQIDAFTTPDGSGCFGFQMVGTAAFTTLDFQVNQTYSSISLSSNAFNGQVTILDDGAVTDMFFTECPDCGKNGFPAETFFTVDLSPGGWGAGTTFYLDANLTAPADNPNLSQQFVPEPSSVLLLSAGVAALASRRKLIKRSQQ